MMTTQWMLVKPMNYSGDDANDGADVCDAIAPEHVPNADSKKNYTFFSLNTNLITAQSVCASTSLQEPFT